MAIGIVVRQRATLDVPSDQSVSSVMLSTLLRRPLWWAGTGVAVIVAAVIVGAVVIAIRVEGWRRAVFFSVAVGVLFGVVAVITKINTYLLEQRGLLGLLATPAPYALVVLGIVATLLQQSAF